MKGSQSKEIIIFRSSPGASDKEDSLNHGHYYGPGSGRYGYTAARQDFAVRSGLIPAGALFTQEQMVGIFYCVQNALDGINTFTAGQDALLQTVREKILSAVPDLDGQLHKFDAQHEERSIEQSW